MYKYVYTHTHTHTHTHHEFLFSLSNKILCSILNLIIVPLLTTWCNRVLRCFYSLVMCNPHANSWCNALVITHSYTLLITCNLAIIAGVTGWIIIIWVILSGICKWKVQFLGMHEINICNLILIILMVYLLLLIFWLSIMVLQIVIPCLIEFRTTLLHQGTHWMLPYDYRLQYEPTVCLNF